ncbi:extracellular superoxide dismutase [Cu-Zn]-like [Glandiceps talaboti]
MVRRYINIAVLLLILTTSTCFASKHGGIFHYAFCGMHSNLRVDEDTGLPNLFSSISGNVQMRQPILRPLFPADYFPVEFRLHLTGFNTSLDIEYMFHIHEFGVIYEGSCDYTGEHIPAIEDNKLAGVLRSLHPDKNGAVILEYSHDGRNLVGPFPLIGRSLVIHGDGTSDIEMKYNSTRLACCIIGESSGSNW